MKIVSGDLIEMAKQRKFDVIIHGCNCFHSMNSGIARQIRTQFPEAYEADLKTAKGSKLKLGGISNGYVDRYGLVVINAYTQYRYGRDKNIIYMDYLALRGCFNLIARAPLIKDVRIGYPLIGAGLGGGDWDRIALIIDEEFRGLDHTLVKWEG
jgi:O-acetyl-ADP-ribose deacetylase (regulator of RNase III)